MSPFEHRGEQLTLLQGMDRSHLTYEQLWLRQLALGGDVTALELEAYLLGLLKTDAYVHDLIAQSLNDFFIDRGEDHPVAYSDVPEPEPL